MELTQKLRQKGKSVYCFIESDALLKNAGLLDEDAEKVMDRIESKEDYWHDRGIREIFESDMNALKCSQNTVVLLPGGKSTHMEAGVSYGMGKNLILIGEVEGVETLYLMFDKHFRSIDEFIDSI